MSEAVIECRGLVKYFGGRRILDEIDLTVPRGCIYGLMGRNGVGKTTLVRILMGLERTTRGTALVLGQDSMSLSRPTKARIGYVAEGHHLIQAYRVSRLVALCRGLAVQWNEAFFSHLVEMFGLPMDRRVRELSNGMRAQLNLALALATDPELLILDDPTLGLDTVVRRQFLELAVDLIQKQGRTILFSSHILSDVERIADRIGILVAGRLVADCSLDGLKERIRRLRLVFPETVPPDLCVPDLIHCQTQGREALLTVANWSERKQRILETFGPMDCTRVPLSLEDIFLECTRTEERAISC